LPGACQRPSRRQGRHRGARYRQAHAAMSMIVREVMQLIDEARRETSSARA
jgi:hypothetical protein